MVVPPMIADSCSQSQDAFYSPVKSSNERIDISTIERASTSFAHYTDRKKIILRDILKSNTHTHTHSATNDLIVLHPSIPTNPTRPLDA